MASGESGQPQASGDSAPAAPSPTLPPPEKPSAVRQRSYVVLSFWLVVLLLGLPIWWKTTAIYRAELPLDRMLKWADGKVRDQIVGPQSGALSPPTDAVCCTGLSTCLPPPDLDTGGFSPGARGPESYPTHPTCIGRSKRLLRSPPALTACATECAPSERRLSNRFDDSPQTGHQQLGLTQPRVCCSRHNLPTQPCPISHFAILPACILHYERAPSHLCRGTVHYIIPPLYILHVHRRASPRLEC